MAGEKTYHTAIFFFLHGDFIRRVIYAVTGKKLTEILRVRFNSFGGAAELERIVVVRHLGVDRTQFIDLKTKLTKNNLEVGRQEI